MVQEEEAGIEERAGETVLSFMIENNKKLFEVTIPVRLQFPIG